MRFFVEIWPIFWKNLSNIISFSTISRTCWLLPFPWIGTNFWGWGGLWWSVDGYAQIKKKSAPQANFFKITSEKLYLNWTKCILQGQES